MPEFSCPTVKSLDQILPDEPLLMMGAGPVPISHQVAYANSLVINHLGPVMAQVIEQVRVMSQYVFQTHSPYIFGVSGPGSATMEMAVANLVEPGDRVLCVCNGYFSSRLAEMARRSGAQVYEHFSAERSFAALAEVEAALEQFKPKILTMVQGETSNTVWNRDLADICKSASARGCLVIVDAVCTLSTMPLKMDEWKVDAVITGGQKGLSSIPGVSLIAFSEKGFEAIRNRRTPLVHWCLDAKLAHGFWNENKYHYTAPTSGVLAIHEALRLVCIETLEKRFERHFLCSSALQQGVRALGLELYVDEPSRLNSVMGIVVPPTVDGNVLRQHMSHTHRVEISGSFGLPIVRIGQMGEQSREHHLFRTLHALGSSLRTLGASVDLATGMGELERALSTPR